jgi:O-antigen ligase
VQDRGNSAAHGHGKLGTGRDATRSATGWEEAVMGTILIVVLVLALVGALPTWSHSSTWGYFPSGGLGVVLLVLLILVLTGRL